MDPKKDAWRIVFVSDFVDLPFMTDKAQEAALLRTFTIPSISRILAGSGNFACNARKRTDDTELLVREFTERHYDSERGSLALQRVNFIHSSYPIENSDYIYVLGLFFVEPYRRIEEMGWRRWTLVEKEAHYNYWHDIGVRMNIRDLPSSFDDFVKFVSEYEAKHVAFHPANRAVMLHAQNIFLDYLPRPLRWFGVLMTRVTVDDRAAMAIGYEPPPVWFRLLWVAFWKATAWIVWLFLPPRPISWAVTRTALQANIAGLYPQRFIKYGQTHYPQGYRIEEMGPKLPGKLAELGQGSLRSGGCPFPKATDLGMKDDTFVATV